MTDNLTSPAEQAADEQTGALVHDLLALGVPPAVLGPILMNYALAMAQIVANSGVSK